MSTSTGLQNSQNFIAQWMTNASRAGVILNSPLCFLDTENVVQLPADGNDSFSSHFAPLHFSNDSSFISVDSLHDEQNSVTNRLNQGEPAVCENSAIISLHSDTVCPANKCTGSHREGDSTDRKVDNSASPNSASQSDPLMQKLEQLRECQQRKQEQLKRQQMQQLQRLVEEQQKLLSMVSAQQALSGLSTAAEKLLLSQGYGVQHSPSFTSTTASENEANLVQSYQRPTAAYIPMSKGLQNHSPNSIQSVPSQQLGKKDSVLFVNGAMSCTSPPQHSEAALGVESDSEEDLDNTVEQCSIPDEQNAEDSDAYHTTKYSSDEDHQSLAEICLPQETELLTSEERPIKPGISGRKQTFEEFLEEQLYLEEQKLKQIEELKALEGSSDTKLVPKRTFLKRGDGLARFTKAKPRLFVQNSEPETKSAINQKTIEHKKAGGAAKQQVQRKMALFNKDSYSENLSGPRSKTNQVAKDKITSASSAQKRSVLGNHNGQNICPAPMKVQTERNTLAKFGQMKDGFTSEMGSKLNNTKENQPEFTKPNKMDNKVKNKPIDTEKCQIPSELSAPLALKLLSNVPPEVAELSFEISFQKKLEKWDKEKEKENIELDEFEFLEQAAEDISFSSNSSLVLKVLQRDLQDSNNRRLSSTPVKSVNQDRMHQDSGNKNKDHSKQVDSHPKVLSMELEDNLTVCDKPLKATSSFQGYKGKSAEDDTSEDKNKSRKNCENTSDSELQTDTTLKHEDDDKRHLGPLACIGDEEVNFKLSAGKTILNDSNKESKNVGQDHGLPDDDYTSEESSVIENQTRLSEPLNNFSLKNKVEFDDDSTWADTEEPNNDDNTTVQLPLLFTSSTKETFPQDKTIKRKVASKRKEEIPPEEREEHNSTGIPGVSDLMTKLFPSLRPKEKLECPSGHQPQLNTIQEQPIADTVQSKILREKLVELETEIERFRAENSALTKLHTEREKALENLRKEIADFEQQKAKELANLEEYKKEEMRKLQKERKVFEKYTAAARAIPDKKEREEVQVRIHQITF
nr:PREDICTED: centromere protein J isoform X1 [Latimeria chalumnae]|eukprot:XP_006013927.1 PREDICTED: centromere protein J isoform X1 [Latimeria chalumnae]